MSVFMALDETDMALMLDRVSAGDDAAGQALLLGCRPRLRAMIALRMDPRLSPRLDPSDVIQDVFAEASDRLADFAQRRPLPFYPWLRQIAWERLVKLHRRHVHAQKRSVAREMTAVLTDASADLLAERFVDSATSPSRHMLREELLDRVRRELALLGERDREVLVLRYLEELSMAEIAAVLTIGEGAAKLRHLRALERLRRRLDDAFDDASHGQRR
ncbi:MAG: sigma-70 family RNA polymerase sigma factor [Pirellulales bacterium]